MLALLILQAAAQAVAPVPTEWAALAPIPYTTAPQVTPSMDNFVAGEIAAGRCVRPKPADGHYIIRADVAVLLGPDNTVHRVIPRAIDCATVEQYTAGLVQSFARDNLRPRIGVIGDQWYRATVTYDWGG